MSSFFSDNSSSTASSSFYYTYNHGFRDSTENLKVKRSDPNRPLSHLVEKESLLKDLKDQKDEPSGMPQEPILFDPKELVLGGKK